jgi:hypothetical protein
MGPLERRAVARLEYPLGLRPVLIVSGVVHQVVDCSERGLRFVAPADGAPDIATEIAGRVRFASGAEAQIEGAVVRVSEGMVAVQFTGIWLSPELIDDERRLLRRLEAAQGESGRAPGGAGSTSPTP